MANIKSAKKRILVTETKTARNKAIKSKVKTYVKKVETAVEKKDVEAAKVALKEAISVINKAGSKGVQARKQDHRGRVPSGADRQRHQIIFLLNKARHSAGLPQI